MNASEEFDEWAASLPGIICTSRDEYGNYTDETALIALMAWKASRKQAIEESLRVVEFEVFIDMEDSDADDHDVSGYDVLRAMEKFVESEE